ncbi:19528_t:CDS:1, partial [Racocetra fulgida]
MADLEHRFIGIRDLAYALIPKLKPHDVQVYIDMKLNDVVIRHLEKYRYQNYQFINDAKENYKPKFVELNHFSVFPHPRCKDEETSTSQ